MPSFLSKVFTRKREEKEPGRSHKRSSVASKSSLLEGKFEAVSPTISPSAAQFPDAAAHENGKEKEKEKEKDRERSGGFPLFRARSPHPVSPQSDAPKSSLDVPHLTLNLPVPKEEKSRALGVVFEADPDDHSTLPDKVIGERRLNPLEALLLIKACSSAIISHGGLETLGVMHPHWYSASPDVQRKLISLFILSLAPKSPITTLSPTPTSPQTIFNTELEYTRSPHDIAAVLRWALRHLRLEGNSFGGANTEQWQWYSTFFEKERASSYPPGAFSEILVPQLPPAHLQLLVATLDIVSSLAAHSERNGISGSKLSKFFGLWLLTAQRSEDNDNWASFYARWEHAGRILEHIFLAQIRDEMTRKKMPLRLAELVASYPYLKGNPPEDGLLPRPRLSTRRHDALHVRVETQLPDFTTPRPKLHPLRIIADAIKSEASSESGEYDGMWEAIRQAAATIASGEGSEESTTEADGYPTLSRVFADETIRLLSFVPADSSGNPVPTIKLSSPPSSRAPRAARRRSSSLGSARKSKISSSGSANGAMSSVDLVAPKDWSDFSTSGFGESALGNDFAKTLLDNDLEVTKPPLVTRKSTKRRRASSPGRSHGDSADKSTAPNPITAKPKTTPVHLTQLDEAFVDFWSDALLDPIASDWPNFVVCQLKPLAGVEVGGKPITWLVLEQVFTRPPPPPEPQPVSPTLSNRASSPRPSLRSNVSARKSSTFSATRKRFTFFSQSPTVGLDSQLATRKKSAKSPRIGEMGEILAEEPESMAPETPRKDTQPEEPKGLGLTGVDIGAGVAVAEPAINSVETSQVKSSDLPAIPIVDTHEASAEAGAQATVPLKQDEESSADKPTVSIPEDVVVPTDAPTGISEAQDAAESKPLPPAPESVVLAGDTPGPQTALSTSEPATLAEVVNDTSAAPTEPIDSSTHLPTNEGQGSTDAEDGTRAEENEAQTDEAKTVSPVDVTQSADNIASDAVTELPVTSSEAVKESVPEPVADEELEAEPAVNEVDLAKEPEAEATAPASPQPERVSRFVEIVSSDSEAEGDDDPSHEDVVEENSDIPEGLTSDVVGEPSTAEDVGDGKEAPDVVEDNVASQPDLSHPPPDERTSEPNPDEGQSTAQEPEQPSVLEADPVVQDVAGFVDETSLHIPNDLSAKEGDGGEGDVTENGKGADKPITGDDEGNAEVQTATLESQDLQSSPAVVEEKEHENGIVHTEMHNGEDKTQTKVEVDAEGNVDE